MVERESFESEREREKKKKRSQKVRKVRGVMEEYNERSESLRKICK